MNQNTQNQLFCPSERQKEVIIKYIKERRTGLMARLYLSAILAVLMFPMAMIDLQVAINGSIFQTKATVGSTIILMACRYHRYRRGRYRDGELFLIWCVILVVFIMFFIKGIGIHFGPHSDLDCVKNGKYLYEIRDCAGKSEDRQKHPYYLYDDENTAYICPLFLEWKKAESGTKMMCLSLQNGRYYALPLLIPDQTSQSSMIP